LVPRKTHSKPGRSTHQAAFDAWQQGEGRGGAASYDAEITQQEGAVQLIEPEPSPSAEPTPPRRQLKPGTPRQVSLFD
jgi:hypothetical protein